MRHEHVRASWPFRTVLCVPTTFLTAPFFAALLEALFHPPDSFAAGPFAAHRFGAASAKLHRELPTREEVRVLRRRAAAYALLRLSGQPIVRARERVNLPDLLRRQ